MKVCRATLLGERSLIRLIDLVFYAEILNVLLEFICGILEFWKYEECSNLERNLVVTINNDGIFPYRKFLSNDLVYILRSYALNK